MVKPQVMAAGVPVWCAHSAIAPLESLVGNPRNPNKHPHKQIELLAKIISAQGWRNPITVSERSGYIVRGHCRLEAAILLGLSEVPIDKQPYANEALEWADLIADNRIAELAELDERGVKDILGDIGDALEDVELTGFGQEEFGKLMETDFGPEDLDSLLDDYVVSLAIEKPIWLVARASQSAKQDMDAAAVMLERKGIKVERSYENG